MEAILLIKTSERERIKTLLNSERINYQVIYDEVLAGKDFTEEKEEIYRRDMRLANQDQERQKEIEFWDKIQAQDNAKLNQNDDEWDWN